MDNRAILFKLKVFNIRIRILNSFATKVDQIKYYFHKKRFPRTERFFAKLSKIFHTLFNNLVKNKTQWQERIKVGEGFYLPEED